MVNVCRPGSELPVVQSQLAEQDLRHQELQHYIRVVCVVLCTLNCFSYVSQCSS